MTLIEAIKSGKRFKRKDYISWTHPSDVIFTATKECVLADDWIIEEKSVTINREDLKSALQFAKVYSEHGFIITCEKLGL